MDPYLMKGVIDSVDFVSKPAEQSYQSSWSACPKTGYHPPLFQLNSFALPIINAIRH